jgi:hypothetical protein
MQLGGDGKRQLRRVGMIEKFVRSSMRGQCNMDLMMESICGKHGKHPVRR